MDPVAAAITDLGGQPTNPYGNPGGFVQQPAPMFGNTPPAPPAPVYQQQPVYQPPQQTPQQPVYAPQPPQPPALPQQQPQAPPNEYPIVPPVQPPQEQMPAWAAGLYEQVQGLQEKITQPTTPVTQGNDWPWADIPKTWAGLRTAIEREATAKADAKVSEYQQLQTVTAQQQEQARVQADQAIDSTLNQLRQTGILPLITNPSDPNDAGKQAERELLGYTIANGGSDPTALARMAPTLRALHDSGIYYDNNQRKLIRRGSQSAAANAPIAGGTPVMGTATAGTGPTTAQLGTMDLASLTQLGLSQLQ